MGQCCSACRNKGTGTSGSEEGDPMLEDKPSGYGSTHDSQNPSPQEVHDDEHRSPLTGHGMHPKSNLSTSANEFFESAHELANKAQREHDLANGIVTVTGELCFGVCYNRHLSDQLEVNVVEARGLAAATEEGTSNPYVKIYLLPCKSEDTKRQTEVILDTLDPVFNETKTYNINEEYARTKQLLVAVYHHISVEQQLQGVFKGVLQRQIFLGEVLLDLSKYDLTANEPQWHKLQEKSCGEVLLALQFMPQTLTEKSRKVKKKGELKGDFQVLVKRARNLAAKDINGLSDPFIKCYLLPDRSKSSKRKTKTIQKDLNPIWEETISYSGLTLDSLQQKVLEVTVWDNDLVGKNDFIGCLRLGLSAAERDKSKEELEPWMDASEVESTHWKEMIENPGTFIEKWHKLRSSTDSRH